MGYWLVDRRPGSADDATPALILLTNLYWGYGTYEAIQAYPRNPVTGELALNGSTDKARFTACVAHVNTIQATQRAMPS